MCVCVQSLLSLSRSLVSNLYSLSLSLSLSTHTHTHTFIQVVLQEMRNRQANGLNKSGRYKSEDTARLKYIHCTGFPLLQKGLLPLVQDIHMLELGPLDTL